MVLGECSDPLRLDVRAALLIVRGKLVLRVYYEVGVVSSLLRS